MKLLPAILCCLICGLLNAQAPTPAGKLPETPLHCEFKPQPGEGFDAEVIEIVDGDTLTVQRKQLYRVRLNKCWAREVRTTNPAEKRLGLLSRAHLGSLALGNRCRVFIHEGEVYVGDNTSLSRHVADVWLLGDDQTLSARQVQARMASTTKGGDLGR